MWNRLLVSVYKRTSTVLLTYLRKAMAKYFLSYHSFANNIDIATT